jgi:hypothetical protein
MAWLLAFRRLTVRDDRHEAPVLAFLRRAYALTRLRFLRLTGTWSSRVFVWSGSSSATLGAASAFAPNSRIVGAADRLVEQ